jgi:hypothetical protein
MLNFGSQNIFQMKIKYPQDFQYFFVLLSVLKKNKTLTNMKNLLFAILFLCSIHTIGLAQGESNKETLKIDAGIFLFNSNWTGQIKSSFQELIGNLSVSKAINNHWDLGLTSLGMKQLPLNQSFAFYKLDFFYISGPFARYYFNEFPLRPFWEGSLEYGNVCNCYFNSSFFQEGRYYFINNGIYLGNNLGLETRITSNFFLKLNVKAYYLFNAVENKGLIVRPFLNFSFRLNKKSIIAPPIINNPRF